MKAGEPLLQDVILYGRELTQDDLFDENEKENISRDMAQLQEDYDELRNFVDDEQERFVSSACYHTTNLSTCMSTFDSLRLFETNLGDASRECVT